MSLIDFFNFLNGIFWHPTVLFVLLGVGVLFTIWSGFGQYRALVHGTRVVMGKYDTHDGPGAISHFQALSAALSATVGLGNIAGVAVAIALGGPGAVFWMWVVGFVGMAIKMAEVTMSMLYRNTDDPDNPHGGPMWVVKKGLQEFSPAYKKLGSFIGGIFCVTLLISAVTGGNMFQAWNVGEMSRAALGMPPIAAGIVLAILVGATIIGGIKRIGAVAGKLVPFMCVLYLIAAFYVLTMQASLIPETFKLIFTAAFSPVEAGGAFLGGTFGYAFLWGMKRALFSNEAGQGSSPIAHSAAKTDEPVREGVVAGLEPFIDTLVVCTLTALVILTSGAWNRDHEAMLASPPTVEAGKKEGTWKAANTPLPLKLAVAKKHSGEWKEGDMVFMVVKGEDNTQTGTALHRLVGEVKEAGDGFEVEWKAFKSKTAPAFPDTRVWRDYAGAALTAYAFDRVSPGLGKWLVTLAAWLFALSTMISWSYYGEQGSVYLFGDRSVLPYKLIYCLLIIVACSGIIKTDAELDTFTALGTGVMLFANIPIMLIFGNKAMKAYHSYMQRLDAGEFETKSSKKE